MKNLPVALQLYTVRDFLEKDVRSTLAKVRELGYEYVEPAGLYGLPAETFRQYLDELGLKAICAHVPLAEMQADPDGVMKTYRKLGMKYIAVPYLAEGQRPGDPGFDKVLADIERIGKAAAENDMQLLYHNHDFEFITLPDGRFGLDAMYETVPAEYLATELDTCWVKVAGQDPAAYIRKYAGRCPVVHLKDFYGSKTEHMYELIGTNEAKAEKSAAFEFRPVGSGVQDIPAILEAALESGAHYVVVEQDSSNDRSSLDAAASSRQYLASLGW